MAKIEKEVSYCFPKDIINELQVELAGQNIQCSLESRMSGVIEFYINTSPYCKEKFVLKKDANGIIVGEYKIKELILNPNDSFVSYKEKNNKNWSTLILGGFSTNCIIIKDKITFCLKYQNELAKLIFQNCTNNESKLNYMEVEFNDYPAEIFKIVDEIADKLQGKRLRICDAKFNKFKINSKFIEINQLSDIVKLYNINIYPPKVYGRVDIVYSDSQISDDIATATNRKKQNRCAEL